MRISLAAACGGYGGGLLVSEDGKSSADDQVAAREGFEFRCPDLTVAAAAAVVWATIAADVAVGASCSARNRGGGPLSSTVVVAGVVWATRRLDLEVVAAVWDVPSINILGSMRIGR